MAVNWIWYSASIPPQLSLGWLGQKALTEWKKNLEWTVLVFSTSFQHNMFLPFLTLLQQAAYNTIFKINIYIFKESFVFETFCNTAYLTYLLTLKALRSTHSQIKLKFVVFVELLLLVNSLLARQQKASSAHRDIPSLTYGRPDYRVFNVFQTYAAFSELSVYFRH